MYQAPYTKLSPFYDRMMNSQKYEIWTLFVKKTLNKYDIQKGICLDLACGTGTMSLAMKSLGFSIIGIDQSQDMLNIAKKKDSKSIYICADIRNFTLNKKEKEQITLAVCFYDSLNYLLSKEELLLAFNNINSNIPDGAYLIFDINTKEHVKNAQLFSPAIFEDNDITCIFRYGGEKNIWELQIDGFVKDNDNTYKHFKENHLEIGYDIQEISAISAQTNFKLLTYDIEVKKGKNNENYESRICFVLKKIPK